MGIRVRTRLAAHDGKGKDEHAQARAREIHRRLDRTGIRATAEVVSSKRILIGEACSPADELGLFVTGAGVTPFEARHTTEDLDRYRLAAHIPVDVDPATNLFRLAV